MKRYSFLILLIIIGLIWLGRYLYFKPAYVNGEVAPDFEFQLVNGEKMTLYDLKGNYLLLDFWGSWCGPCRKENPELVKLYQKFNGKQYEDADDFTIVSIGLEMKRARWLAAIEKDNLSWPYHHADFDRMNSPIAQSYGVREIPTKFLITPDGYIAGVNPTPEEIESFLTSRLAK